MTVLLSEGSSLSARHAVSALGPAGHALDLLDPAPFCLARFSCYVRSWYRCPLFAAAPAGYLECLEARLCEGRYDALLPVHDQVYLVSRFQDRLRKQVGLAVPPFSALERVQSKAEFVRLLAELGLSCPPTTFVHSRTELERLGRVSVLRQASLWHSGPGCLACQRSRRDAVARVPAANAGASRWT